MSDSLGARLRHRREQQGIALRAIASETKINLSLLEGLERDDTSRWPTGIFRRAYFRSYAGAIGLDVDEALREFLAAHPDPRSAAPAEPAVTAAAGESASVGRTPPTRFHMMLGRLSRAVFGEGRTEAPAEEPPAPTVHVVAETSDVAVAEPEPAVVPDEPARETTTSASDTAPVEESRPAPAEVDVHAVAQLCTVFGRAAGYDDVQEALRQAAGVLAASGLIVWSWDRSAGVLRPALAHGYSRRMLAQLSPVEPAAENPTADAFRSVSTVAVSDRTHGALVVPLVAPRGCAGVLALELPRGREHEAHVQALATIVASLVVLVTGDPAPMGATAPVSAARHRPPRQATRRRSAAAYR